MQDIIKEIIARKLGKVLINEKISNYTTYKVGGKVRAIVYPKTEEELCELVKLLKEKQVKYFVLGNGSNVLFSDNLYDGIIIKLDYFNNIEFFENIVSVGAGVSLMKLSRETVKRGFKGLEFADGIPATVGGAVFMNAGAYGSDMSKIIVDVTIVNGEGEIQVLSNKEMAFSYRTTYLQKHLDCVCIGARIKLSEGSQEELSQLVLDRRNKRKMSQPLSYPSAGSVFRNPKDMYAGEIIEKMGLKGFSVGKAEISEKHANFIINKGNAKASDIKKIIDYIKEKAKSKYNIRLRVEQRLINWDNDEESKKGKN